MEITSKTPNNSSSFLSNLSKNIEQTNNPNNQIDISKIFTNSSIISMIPSSSSELNILELNKESPLNNNKKLQQNKLSEPINGKRNFAQLAKEKIEPYVRKRHNSGSSSERSRKRLNNLNEEEQNILRTNINSRERKRMHDINVELDELRRVLPYTDIFQQQKEQNDEKQSKQQFKQNNARKLSKINTIILATNWIRHLNKELLHLKSENKSLKEQFKNNKMSEENEGNNFEVFTSNQQQQQTNSNNNLLIQPQQPSISLQRPLQQNLLFQPLFFQNCPQLNETLNNKIEELPNSSQNGRRKYQKKNQGQLKNSQESSNINEEADHQLITTNHFVENFASVQQLLALGIQTNRFPLPIFQDQHTQNCTPLIPTSKSLPLLLLQLQTIIF
uniref:BHLH domain-containing protein n=1 Tax=Meloidogyne enterolobii TaxID=390850 RepID=A0A6V7VND0_MELEN|nr:unnamed protein product [Meloidogyne enterolobii]